MMRELCGAEVRVAGKRFRCIRPAHAWKGNDDALEHWRRRGVVRNPDRHVFVKVEEKARA